MSDVSCALIYGAGHDEAETTPMEAAPPAGRTETSSLPSPPASPEPDVNSTSWECGPTVARFRPLDEVNSAEAVPGQQIHASVPTISPCIPNRPMRDLISLTNRRMFWSLMAVAFALTVCLGRVHLRFSTEDLKTQHVRLQTMRRTLEREAALLENRSSDCWDSSLLQEAILRSGNRRFVTVQAASLSAVSVPADLRMKYMDQALAESAMARAVESENAGTGRVAGLLKLVEAGKAYAATRY